MLCRRKPSSRRRRIKRYILRAAILLLIPLIYFEVAVRVQLSEIIRAELCSLALSAVNTAVEDFLAENPDVGDRLTALRCGDGGGVAALTTDPAYINYLKANISERAQKGIDAMAREQGIEAPLGSFSGLVFLSRIGPPIRIEIACHQTVSCALKSTFESAGINQTLHHIALIVTVDITVHQPFRIRGGVRISADYEIAQTVLIGSVPSYGGVVTY